MIQRELLRALLLKNLRLRYRSALFGYVWAAAAPLLFAAVYAAAFGVLGVARPPHGWRGFLLGVAVWQWAAGVLGHSTSLYGRNLNLVRRIPLRWSNHALACVLCEAAPLVAILPLTGPYLAAPLLLVLQAAAFMGWAAAAGALNALVTDLERLAGPFAAALFFATPVAYDPSILPPELQAWLLLNPAAVFVEAWRAAYAGTLGGTLLAACLAHAAFGVGLAAAVERTVAPKLAEYA